MNKSAKNTLKMAETLPALFFSRISCKFASAVVQLHKPWIPPATLCKKLEIKFLLIVYIQKKIDVGRGKKLLFNVNFFSPLNVLIFVEDAFLYYCFCLNLWVCLKIDASSPGAGIYAKLSINSKKVRYETKDIRVDKNNFVCRYLIWE